MISSGVVSLPRTKDFRGSSGRHSSRRHQAEEFRRGVVRDREFVEAVGCRERIGRGQLPRTGGEVGGLLDEETDLVGGPGQNVAVVRSGEVDAR